MKGTEGTEGTEGGMMGAMGAMGRMEESELEKLAVRVGAAKVGMEFLEEAVRGPGMHEVWLRVREGRAR